MSEARNMLESFRDVAQDLLVPELKAVKVSVDSLRTDMKLNIDAVREEMKLTSQLLKEEMRFRYESLEKTISENNERLVELIRHGDERNERSLQVLADRMDVSAQLRERIAALEARLPHQ